MFDGSGQELVGEREKPADRILEQERRFQRGKAGKRERANLSGACTTVDPSGSEFQDPRGPAIADEHRHAFKASRAFNPERTSGAVASRTAARTKANRRYRRGLRPIRPRIRRGGPATTTTFTATLVALEFIALVGITAGLAAPLQALSTAALAISLVAIAGAAAVVTTILRTAPTTRSLGRRRRESVRVAIIGPERYATAIDAELAAARVRGFQIVGWIDSEGHDTCGGSNGEGLPAIQARRIMGCGAEPLGQLCDVPEIVRRHAIELVLLAGPTPRLLIFEELITRGPSEVSVWELSSFYEEVFGHVPVMEINGAWFQYVLHPRYRTHRRLKRVFDLLITTVLSAVSLPLVGLLALFISRDGGSPIYRQLRVGERGQPFTLYKLRTMHPVEGVAAAQWSCADDPRVTALGHFLRRTHLDELPQLYNVLRGDMSLVGPRPEQPEFANRLERSIPYWRGRYQLKPGITGWAQVRCGYSGSDNGSAWKLCHDLFYLKHQSLAFDVALLIETVRALFVRPQFLELPETSFVTQSSELRSVGEGSLSS